MTLRKLVLSVSLLAALLMLAAPAQAETWACNGYELIGFDRVEVKGDKPFVFVRKGKTFEFKGSPLTFRISQETPKLIVLARSWYDDGKGPDLTRFPIPYVKDIASWNANLFKPLRGEKQFTLTFRSEWPEFTKKWTGDCTVY